MNNALLAGFTTLQQCEEVLKKLVEPGELLGRIPLTTEDWKTIAYAFNKLLTKYGESDGTAKIWANFPTCASLYLVHAGIWLYEKGEFWPKLYKNIRITHKTNFIWAQRFIAFLERNNLPTFADTGGYHYLTPILGHGGIPTYCLSDFFKFVLSQAMLSTEVSGDDVLNDLADSTRVDKPILRFLSEGGDYALDFVHRCMEMAQEYNTRKLVASEQIGLPTRIVSHYLDWIQKEVAVGIEDNANYLISPSIHYQPYELGIFMNLPNQRLKGWVHSAEWKIISDNGSIKIVRCHPQYINGNSEISVQELPLSPAEEFHIVFLENGIELRKWVLKFPKAKPFLAFNPDIGRLIRTDGISGEETWLVLQNDWNIQTGEIKVIEEFPPLGIPWSNFRGLLVQFNRSSQLALRGPQGKTFTVPIINKLVKPRLVGGKVFAQSKMSDCQIYTNEIPYIRFPHPANGQSHNDWWNKWSISVNYYGGASHLFQVSDYKDQLLIEEHHSLLPLGSTTLLHKKIAHIKLKIKGPLGYDAILQFIIFPNIDFRLLSHTWPTGMNGSPEIKFHWTMPKDYEVKLETGSGRILDEKVTDWGHRHVTGKLLASALNIAGELNFGPSESYSFVKNVRPVRWGWLGLDQTGAVQWDTSVRKINYLDWGNNPNTTLIIQFTDEGNHNRCGEVTLRDVSRKDLYTESFVLSKTKYHKYSLARWFDAVAASPSSKLHFWVRIFEGDNLLTQFCPAEVIKKWEIIDLQVLPDDMRGISFTRCNVYWEESFRITGKTLRIWSVWRPWEEPRTFEIDDNSDNLTIELASVELAPGIYRFEITESSVVDEFSDEQTVISFPVETCFCDLKVKTTDWHHYLVKLPDCISGDLEKYLATTYPNKTFNHYAHSILPDPIDIEHARQIVASYQTIACQSSSDSFRDFSYYLQPYLTESNKILILQAIAQWIQEGRRLEKMVPVGLGLEKIEKNVDLLAHMEAWELEALWAYWPVIGFLAELNHCGHDTLYEHMETYFSRTGLELLFGRPTKSPFQKNGEHCEITLHSCINKLFDYDCICNSILPEVPEQIIGDFNGASLFAQKNLEELQLLFENIELHPEGLFHSDFIANEIYSWLIMIKKDKLEEHLNNLTKKFLAAAETELNKWQSMDIFNVEIINTLIKRRCSDQGTLSLVNFPYLVGFCALFKRLVAKGLLEDTTQWDQLLYEVVKSCPDLYCHDLCLFEILLMVWL